MRTLFSKTIFDNSGGGGLRLWPSFAMPDPATALRVWFRRLHAVRSTSYLAFDSHKQESVDKESTREKTRSIHANVARR